MSSHNRLTIENHEHLVSEELLSPKRTPERPKPTRDAAQALLDSYISSRTKADITGMNGMGENGGSAASVEFKNNKKTFELLDDKVGILMLTAIFIAR